MTLEEFKKRVYEYNVPERWYSLEGNLEPDTFILYRNYSKRECFYLDEKGNRLASRVFNNDEDAYNYIWEMIEKNLKVFKIPPREKK